MAIDPGSVKVCDKVIDVVQPWGGFLLNSLPCYSSKAWGNKAGSCCLLHKAFEDSILRSVQLLQPQSLDLSPNCLGVIVVAAPVFSGQNVQLENIDADLLEIGEN